MGKKGYFFTLDAFIAMTLLVIGVMMMFYFRSEPRYASPTLILSEDVSSYLSSNKIYQIDSKYLDELRETGYINDTKQTVLELIGELYHKSTINQSIVNCSYCMDMAKEITKNVTYGIIPDQYNFELKINNESIYNITKITKNEATVVVASPKLVSGMYGVYNLWGPYAAEVIVWQ